MAYTKFHENWENLPSEETPVTAEALNHIEDGIASATADSLDYDETMDVLNAESTNE